MHVLEEDLTLNDSMKKLAAARFTKVKLRRIWSFQVFDCQRTASKYTNKGKTRAEICRHCRCCCDQRTLRGRGKAIVCYVNMAPLLLLMIFSLKTYPVQM